ncbi:hypothetical protein EV356DRAFT_472486 [Viridothelium virens]|uniref:Uncharacterized protein n=1 Tax=Viridothelium virens TaxID=1048519 RepID=A0A6A6GZX7_VIRVR|nr:hypothetical protein EV356DRAFT_472486 [Viridothelium virens]
MGVQPLPPYIFPPNRQAEFNPTYDFDPKAVTRASYAASLSKSEKPKREGPYLDLNRHPDSWSQAPYGQINVKPMNPRTRAAVKWTRWVQLSLRILQEIGALGALFCVITLKGMLNGQAWIVRVPPAADILISLYAIVHLARRPQARTPGSSASYHFFALLIDLGLIPFYAFTMILAHTSAIEQPGAEGRWRTLFSSENTTNMILQLTWLLALVLGSLHLVSFGLDIYLVLVFRKIASMPPDMNPLEGNLTSRRASKHKHKDSEMTASTVSKSSPLRMSQVNLIPDSRTIPFVQTRNESDPSFSPHNPETARLSRTELSMYSQSQSARTSRADLHRRDGSVSPSKHGTLINVQEVQPRSPTRHSTRTNALSHRASFHNTLSDVASQRGTPGPPRSGASTPHYNQNDTLLSDNWFVIDGEADGDLSDNGSGPPVPPRHPRHSGYAPIPISEAEPEPDYDENSIIPQPLRMNPPTPAPERQRAPAPFAAGRSDPTYLGVNDMARVLTVTSQSSSKYSDPPPSPTRCGTPKSRHYGDLADAMSGILSNSPSRTTLRSGQSPKNAARTAPAPRPLEREGNPRVVSRTGIDLADASVMYVPADERDGRNGKREVSGKVAEEGRGTWFRRREPSGRA